jgi:hypothetical protein
MMHGEMALAALLGLNGWVVSVLVPLLRLEAGWVELALGALGPLALWAGLRARSALLLFGAVPLLDIAPTLRSSAPAPIALTLPCLIAYALAAARALQSDATPPATAQRALADEALPHPHRARMRVYNGFAVAAALLPASLLWALHRPQALVALTLAHGPRARMALTLATALVGFAQLLLVRAHLIGPLEAHLQHDRDLRGRLASDRAIARRGRPRVQFFAHVALALLAMAAVLWTRWR